MQIKLSKQQWEEAGRKAGWIKASSGNLTKTAQGNLIQDYLKMLKGNPDVYNKLSQDQKVKIEQAKDINEIMAILGANQQQLQQIQGELKKAKVSLSFIKTAANQGYIPNNQNENPTQGYVPSAANQSPGSPKPSPATPPAPTPASSPASHPAINFAKKWGAMGLLALLLMSHPAAQDIAHGIGKGIRDIGTGTKQTAEQFMQGLKGQENKVGDQISGGYGKSSLIPPSREEQTSRNQRMTGYNKTVKDYNKMQSGGYQDQSTTEKGVR